MTKEEYQFFSGLPVHIDEMWRKKKNEDIKTSDD